MHVLASIQHIVMNVSEPHRMLLIQKAAERGIMYKLKCTNPQGLKTRYGGVNRNFKAGEEKLLPALVSAFIIQTYNVDMVAGSKTHPGGAKGSDTPAPFFEPNFEEIVDETRTDLGPDLKLMKGATMEEMIQEATAQAYAGRAGGRSTSGDVSTDEIREVTPGASGKPAKVPTEGI